MSDDLLVKLHLTAGRVVEKLQELEREGRSVTAQCDICGKEINLTDRLDSMFQVEWKADQDLSLAIAHRDLARSPRLIAKALTAQGAVGTVSPSEYLAAMAPGFGESDFLLCPECAPLVPPYLADGCKVRFEGYRIRRILGTPTQPAAAARPAEEADAVAKGEISATGAFHCPSCGAKLFGRYVRRCAKCGQRLKID